MLLQNIDNQTHGPIPDNLGRSNRASGEYDAPPQRAQPPQRQYGTPTVPQTSEEQAASEQAQADYARQQSDRETQNVGTFNNVIYSKLPDIKKTAKEMQPFQPKDTKDDLKKHVDKLNAERDQLDKSGGRGT